MRKPLLPTLALALLATLFVTACSEHDHSEVSDHYGPDTQHGHHHDHHHHHGHSHEPPHGGVPVVLGEDEFHLELVHAPQDNTMLLYILDGCLEEFVRIPQMEIRMLALKAGEAEPREVVFLPQAHRATGETEGNTSMFAAEIDWLPEDGTFAGEFVSLTIGESTFAGIHFSFPRGHEIHEH